MDTGNCPFFYVITVQPMRDLTDIQLRILKEEFPDANLYGDTDIERYFELRKNGRQADALSLYNSRIRSKYPDEAKRTLLLRAYRSRDPAYEDLYRESLVELADRAVSRTYRILDALCRGIDDVRMRDAYSVIKHAEGLLGIISTDRYVAIAFTEKYARYARLLSYREREMAETAELIRLYVTETLESVEEFKREREERRKARAAANRRAALSGPRPSFDLTAVVFSTEDVRRILIPQGITRTEDQVIGYCIKYWPFVGDPAFEKTVFLYSRKFHTRHHDIFQAIKNGVTHGWKDEEILNAVLANVVTGYYYSISGDRYLQHTWARYRGQTQGTQPQSMLPILSQENPMPELQNQAIVRARRKVRKTTNIGKSAARKKASPRLKTTKTRVASAPAQVSAFTPNSIADIIRKITGKTYAVYKDLFFRDIRPAIRAVLAETGGKDNPFGTRQNNAEQTLYDYLFENWNNPYQKWDESGERLAIKELGYHIPDLEPIIERWMRDSR